MAYTIEVGYSPRVHIGGALDGSLAWATVSGPGLQRDWSENANGLSWRRALWAALRWALRHVPDGAEVAIRADRASIPLVRALLPLMLGDEPRVAARVDADDAVA